MDYLVPALFIGAPLWLITITLATQRRRMQKVQLKVGKQGLEYSVDLYEAVRQEVDRIQSESLARMVSLDRQLIEFWEREYSHKQFDSATKLKLLADKVAELEQLYEAKPSEQRIEIGWALREIYGLYLRQAREHWSSGDEYHRIKERVVAGLAKLEQLAPSKNLTKR